MMRMKERTEDRGREGREAERTVKEWHLPTAIHRFSVHATTAAMPHLPTPPSPSQATRVFFKKKKTLSSSLNDEVTDQLDCSVSVNQMIGSSGGLQQVSERGLILCG